MGTGKGCLFPTLAEFFSQVSIFVHLSSAISMLSKLQIADRYNYSPTPSTPAGKKIAALRSRVPGVFSGKVSGQTQPSVSNSIALAVFLALLVHSGRGSVGE